MPVTAETRLAPLFFPEPEVVEDVPFPELVPFPEPDVMRPELSRSVRDACRDDVELDCTLAGGRETGGCWYIVGLYGGVDRSGGAGSDVIPVALAVVEEGGGILAGGDMSRYFGHRK